MGKRLQDFDEYSQSIPKNRPLGRETSVSVRSSVYATRKELIELQTDLKEQLAEQTAILEHIMKLLLLAINITAGTKVELSDTDDPE